MKFKIIQKGALFYVKRRIWFFWVTEQRELGWNCSENISFPSMQDAEKYITQSVLDTVEIVHAT